MKWFNDIVTGVDGQTHDLGTLRITLQTENVWRQVTNHLRTDVVIILILICSLLIVTVYSTHD